MRLTKVAVAKLSIPDGKSERIVFDDELPGFGLRLRAGGSAVWIAQYRIGTQQRRVTLGKLSTLDPDKARVEARKVLANADLGTDVQAERRRRQANEAVTFSSVVDLYLVHAEKALRPRTVVEVRRYFARDWKPFRPLPIGEVQRAEISARLRVIAEN